MCGVIFYIDMFIFQIGKGFIGVFFGNYQCGVCIIGIVKGDLFIVFWGNVYFGNDGIIFFEFQCWDKIIESMIGKSIFCLYLFV